MSVNVESSLDLSPEIIKLRDSYLNALEKMPKEEHDNLIRKQLEKEENDKNRMALLACRTLLLREKTVVLRAEIDDDHPSTMLKKFREKTFSSTLDKDSKQDQSISENTKLSSENSENDWIRLKMLQSGNVNGVKFPPGVVIEVSKIESEKLIADGSAEVVNSSNENNANNGEETSNEIKENEKQNEELQAEEVKDKSEEVQVEDGKDKSEEVQVEDQEIKSAEEKIETSKSDEEEALKALSEFGNTKAKK